MSQTSEIHLVDHYSHLGNFQRDFRNKNLFQLIAKKIAGHSVVDVGCGAGFFADILIQQGKEVVGIEPNEGMRELAVKINPQIKIIPGSAEEIDRLITTQPEYVTMLDVLEHVEHDTEQVIKIHKTLAPNGSFVIVVPAYQFLYGKRDVAMGHYRRYSTRSLTEILTAHGFKIESIRYWNALGVLPYIISEKIFKKPLRVRLREQENLSYTQELVRKGLDFWMHTIENSINFGFGLSIICVARKE